MTIDAALFSRASDEWATPQDLYDRLNNVWAFTVDVCATEENAKNPKFYTREVDGLTQDWSGETAFCNPPFSQGKLWIKKAYEEAQQPGTVVVMLLPARTDTKAWQMYCAQAALVRFLPGRLKFGGSKNGAPFPSAIVIFGKLAG